MARTGQPRALTAGFLFLVLLAVTAACTDDGSGSSGAPATGTSASTPAVATAEPVPEDPICRGGVGATVQELPDLTIPSVEVAPVVDPGSGAVLVPGFTLPEQHAEAGCVVRHDAPGGCVGAVDISAAGIPAVTIPESTVDGRVYPAVTVPPVTQPGAHADEVCQVRDDGGLQTVTREGVVREGFSRSGGARPGDDRVPTIHVEPVEMPDVDVDPVRLSRQELPGGDGVGVLDGADRTSYVAPAEVLFDTESAELRPAAGPALREIVRRIRTDDPGARLLVEGHTDDRGDADYGLRLSERRAETVARWLVDIAGFDRSAITTHGYGETRPAYPNDSTEHRQLNRRVVITVVRGSS